MSALNKGYDTTPCGKKKVNFLEFVTVWNSGQGLTTPNVHMRIVQYLASLFYKNKTKALLMAFRGCGKSTLVGLFCTWLLYRNPNLRILVLSAETDLAVRMVRTVRGIIEKHPLTTWLKPKKTTQWAGDCFIVNRPQDLRESSMYAAGILSNITGARADVIICDDVEVPNTSDSAMKRDMLRKRLNEVDYILVPNGLQLYVGTPHNQYSIYNDKEMGDVKPYLLGFERLRVPLVNERGNSVWVERFGNDDVKLLQKRHGVHKFSTQMQLECVQSYASRLDTEKIHIYNDTMECVSANGVEIFKIGTVKMVSCCCVWDPSYGVGSSDDSVVVCVFTGENGKYYVQDLKKLYVDIADDVDPARQQCLAVMEFIKKHNIPKIYLESNGIGKFLPRLLQNVLQEYSVKSAVLDFHSTESKNARIMQAFDVVIDAGHLWVHDTVVQKGFLQQISDFNPLSKGNKDDMIDAVAGCLRLEPIRLTHKSGAISSSFSSVKMNKKTRKATTDFKIF